MQAHAATLHLSILLWHDAREGLSVNLLHLYSGLLPWMQQEEEWNLNKNNAKNLMSAPSSTVPTPCGRTASIRKNYE